MIELLDRVSEYYNSEVINHHTEHIKKTGSKKVLCDLLYLMTVGVDLHHPANNEMKVIHGQLSDMATY